MPSALPTESSLDKSVETFGLGTYDYPQSGFTHGEDSNRKKSERTLPDDGGSLDPIGPDRLISYPQAVATTMVPGDVDRGPLHRTPPADWIDSVVHSVSQARLPSGGDTPARADYYDKMTVGNLVHSLDDMTADEDAGVFASESYDSIPVPPSDYAFHDNNLQSLGNYWSGVTIEDQAVPAGFPSTEFEDPQRYQVTNASGNKMKKVATNIPLVLDLSSKFLKEYGKKGLTRRHVMAFLQKSGSHQYLASDVVRCLKEVHDIDVKDVLDEFPITHTASSSSLASMRDMLVDLEIHNIRNPETSKVFRYAAADLSRTIALLERLGVDNV